MAHDMFDCFQLQLLQSYNGTSGAIAFPSSSVHPQVHTSQQGLVQPGLQDMANPPDSLGRSMNTQMAAVHEYKKSKMQVFVYNLSFSTNISSFSLLHLAFCL